MKRQYIVLSDDEDENDVKKIRDDEDEEYDEKTSISQPTFESVFNISEQQRSDIEIELVNSDALIAFHVLKSQYPNDKNIKGFDNTILPPFPVVFLHQLYTTLENKQFIDSEVDRLSHLGIIKKFVYNSHEDEYLLCLCEDYLEFIRETIYPRIPTKFISSFLYYLTTQNTYYYITPLQLCLKCQLEKSDQEQFCKILFENGLINRKITNSEILYFNTYPKMGSFYKCISIGREEVLKILKHSKSMMTKDVFLSKKTNRLPYGSLFHFRDMMGRGSILCKTSPNKEIVLYINS
ncbi:hypothetical protein WA158_002424 [Blastocystis sp. Blastoise]